MATIAQLLTAQHRLVKHSDSAALDTALLLSHCLQRSTTYLRTWPETEVDREVQQAFEALMARREQGEPIAYLIGERGFWTLDLEVSPATLIPRPETELLVEQVLLKLADCRQAAVLDLGTGTGAIALALASEQPHWQLTACDVQPDAVQLAERNRQALALSNVSVLNSDWFASIGDARFDCIVSNPPYIDADDGHLSQGDVRFEPRSALVAKNCGLADIEKIISGSDNYLLAGGWLLLEHGYNQAEAVRQLLRQAGFQCVFTERDLADLERVSGGQRPSAEE